MASIAYFTGMEHNFETVFGHMPFNEHWDKGTQFAFVIGKAKRALTLNQMLDSLEKYGMTDCKNSEPFKTFARRLARSKTLTPAITAEVVDGQEVYSVANWEFFDRMQPAGPKSHERLENYRKEIEAHNFISDILDHYKQNYKSRNNS